MNKPATKEDINEVITVIRDFMHQVDTRFTKIEQEISKLKESHNRLINTIDGFVGRIDKYETEMAARDSQFERLLSWAHKVSKKTGIPLENL